MLKRLSQVVLLVVLSFTMLGAGAPSTRFDKLGHKLMCTCGCGEILLECNHVGCPVSSPMIGELRNQIASGMPDKSIFGWFADKYGPVVLAAPIRGGFDLVAWIIPFTVLILGAVGVIWILRHWRGRHTAVAASGTPGGAFQVTSNDLRDRVRRETTFEP